jgi:probable rRNA maturation factor
MKFTLHVQNVSQQKSVPKRNEIAGWARAALKGFEREQVELGVRIVDVPESAELNLRYRDKPGPTNVLSFPFENPPGVETAILGDLVICAPVVTREANAQHKAKTGYWAHMVVHGIMHLRGFDHQNERDANIMQGMETQVLQSLGFSDPYL